MPCFIQGNLLYSLRINYLTDYNNCEISLIKKFIYLFISLILFFAGMLLYGKLLRIKENKIIPEEKGINISDSAKVRLKISLKKYRLALIADNVVLKEYRVYLGHSNNKMASLRNGYVTTPVGKYKITSIDTNKLFFLRIDLNYPNSEDIKTAFKNHFISKEEFTRLWRKINKNESFKFDKKIFGSKISIEGYGKLNYILENLPFVFNWTNGSIALSNEDIAEITKFIKIGTEVKIAE